MQKGYPISKLDQIHVEALLNKKGENIQQHFFYNDKDGEASFNNWLNTCRKDVCQVEDKGTYVIVTQKYKGKSIIVYANKPSFQEKGMKDIKEALANSHREATVIVHRGHSYYVSETIDQIPSSAKIIMLGSCGGDNQLSAVLTKAPSAHIIATKGTGTMTVNDPLLAIINQHIVTQNTPLVWQDIWKSAEAKLKNKKDFNAYICPPLNTGALFLASYLYGS
jgi:hypothetical protein